MTIDFRSLHRRARVSLLAVGLAIGGAAIDGGHANAEPPNAFPFPVLEKVDDGEVDRASVPQTDRLSEAAVASDSYVLLRNDNLLVGQVLRLGNTIEIKRGDGSAIRVASGQVSLVAASAAELYEYRKSNRFTGDVAAIQADVRWYLRNDMLRQAARDALLAREINPRGAETNRLLRQIAGRLRADLRQKTSEPSPVQTVSHEAPIEEQPERDDAATNAGAESLGMPEESIYWYQARVQPIFFNRCSGCHTKQEDNERAFQIHPASRARWAPSSTARENLVQILKFVNRDDLVTSEIRTRAMDGHGGSKRSFGQEDSPMMMQLDRWLASLPPTGPSRSAVVTAAAPMSRNAADFSRVAAAPMTLDRSVAKVTPWSEPSDFADEQFKGFSGEQSPQESAEQMTAGPPAEQVRRMPEVKNPFDPDIFNRRFHSQPPQ